MNLLSPLLTLWLSVALVLGLPGVGAAPLPQDAESTAAETVTFERHIAPFLEQYCAGCHGERNPKAEINFTAYESASSVVKDRKVWEKALEVLVHRQMPPEKRRQPSEAEREMVGRWIHAELASFDCGGDMDPGRVTMRRLNRTEYDRTVRDLLGVDFRPAEDFPADDVGYGFDNIGDVLSMPPLLVEKYVEAAEKVVDEAIAAEMRSKHAPRRYQAENLQATESASADVVGNSALSINREGEAWVEHEFPESGTYLLQARAFAQQAGPELARMGFRLDGAKVKDVEIAAESDAPTVYDATVNVEAGRRRFAVAYLNNYSEPDGDRNLIVDWVEVQLLGDDETGPRRIFTAWPAGREDYETCARKILASFLPRAYRRPVEEAELDRLIALFGRSVEGKDSFATAISVALKASLSSPHFLFKVETQGAPAGSDEASPLSDYELASRLSYFLWSSMPDAELFALAEAGQLSRPDVLKAQALRLLADSRSKTFVESFAGQWLQTRRLPGLSPDPSRFPGVDADLLLAMERETLLYFEAIAREDRSILEFIDSDFTFVNGRLARHYGIDGVDGGQFQRVSLADSERGGVLTQASILTLTSNPTRTSPVKRGLWILEQILDDPPPPPPPNVEQLSEEPEAILSGSLRQRMEKHRTSPSCSVCHERMDAIGFAFENFDAVGAWRDFDGQFEIDPAGTLPDGRRFEGPTDLKRILMERAEKFAHALASKTLTYALGRGLEYYDKCAVDGIVASLVENDYRFSQLILGVVSAEPFRKRRGGTAEP